MLHIVLLPFYLFILHKKAKFSYIGYKIIILTILLEFHAVIVFIPLH